MEWNRHGNAELCFPDISVPPWSWVKVRWKPHKPLGYMKTLSFQGVEDVSLGL